MKSKAFLLVTSYLLLVTMLGCDAFVRKFTRKPKTQELPQEEMVLVPEEYKAPQATSEEQYRQYFLFWKSWQSELIDSLLQNKSQKKKLDCIEEALSNLINLKGLLNTEAQKNLDIYIAQLTELRDQISRDLYGNNSANNSRIAERIKRNILRDFSYNDIRDYLI